MEAIRTNLYTCVSFAIHTKLFFFRKYWPFWSVWSLEIKPVTVKFFFFRFPDLFCLLQWIWLWDKLGPCWSLWAMTSMGIFLTKRDNSSGFWISVATRINENYKMASRSPGGLEWSISIKPLLIAPSASLDVEILPKFCKSITLRYEVKNVYVTL